MFGVGYLRKWRVIFSAPQRGWNNFFNIGITCIGIASDQFGKLTPQ
jgi:hypothetical protein